jgi:cytochrome P450
VSAPVVSLSPQALRKHLRRAFADLASRGDLVWVDTGRQRFLVVQSPELVREVMIDRAEELVKPGSQVLETGPPRPVSVADGVPVPEFRAALAKGMGPGRIPEVLESAAAAAREEVAQWRDGMRFRLMPRMRRLAITALCGPAFGSRLSPEEVALAERAVHWIGRYIPVGSPAARRWDRLTLNQWRRRGSHAQLVALSDRLVANADRSRPTELTAALDDLPRLAPSLSRHDLRAMLVELLVGAVGPLAQACAWALLRFSTEPEAAARLRSEWEDAPPTGKLPYTEAFVREVTRLHPTNERITRQAVAETTLGGERIPELTRVILNVRALHGSPRFFEEPERFAPERWLDGRPTPHKFAYVAFGVGGRRCLGETMAVAALSALLPSLLRDWGLSFGKLRFASKGRYQPAESVKVTVRALEQRPPDGGGELSDRDWAGELRLDSPVGADEEDPRLAR